MEASCAPGCSTCCTTPWSGILGSTASVATWRTAGRDAIDQNIPAPVITLALQMRIASRQEESFSAKVQAALRNEFGGHAVKKG